MKMQDMDDYLEMARVHSSNTFEELAELRMAVEPIILGLRQLLLLLEVEPLMATPRTTATPTKTGQWDVLERPTAEPIPQSSPQLGDLPEPERSLVESYLDFADRLDAMSASYRMRAQVAASRYSI